MATKTRQERRAEARAKAKHEIDLAAGIERVEPSMLQMLISAQKNFQAAQQAVVEAQGAVNHVSRQIAEKHKLGDGDQIDMSTGVIRRGAAKKRGKKGVAKKGGGKKK